MAEPSGLGAPSAWRPGIIPSRPLGTKLPLPPTSSSDSRILNYQLGQLPACSGQSSKAGAFSPLCHWLSLPFFVCSAYTQDTVQSAVDKHGAPGSSGLIHTLAKGQLLEWGAPAPPQVCLRSWVLSLGLGPHSPTICVISKDPLCWLLSHRISRHTHH